jgi:hypothetical protein
MSLWLVVVVVITTAVAVVTVGAVVVVAMGAEAVKKCKLLLKQYPLFSLFYCSKTMLSHNGAWVQCDIQHGQPNK